MRRRWSYSLVLLLLMVGCYPISTGSMRWRIKFDKDKIHWKEDFLARVESPGEEAPPNVIFILADDLGKYEVSAYGDSPVPTPHIDAIGSEGVLFAECYVTAPICGPSRAGIMTGRYQQRFGFETQPLEYYPSNFVEYYSGRYLINTDDMILATKPHYPREWMMAKQGIPPSEITLAELFKKYKYRTGMMGKWHLGNAHWHLPNNRGFDEFYGFLSAFSLYYRKKNAPEIENHIQDIFTSRYQWKHGRQDYSAIRRNKRVVKEDRYLSFAIRDEALQFIDDNRDKPFFLYLPFSAPHVPFQAPREYFDKFAHIPDHNKRVYYAMISALDDAIGDIMARLDSLGLADNTLVIFLSDNGGATYTGATDNGDLKGGKFTTFEGGLNVPFMMRWKSKIAPGQRYAQPVVATDIFSTISAAVGMSLPDDRVYDGVNLIPYLDDEQSTPHPALYWRNDHNHAMRKGDYKFILSTRDGWVLLYNLREDKSEMYNLRDELPGVLEEMLEEYEVWEQGLTDPLWPRLMDFRFVIDSSEYLFPS